MKKGLLVLTTLTFVFWSVTAASAATITGTVYDQGSTTPIADARVNIYSDRCHNGHMYGVQTDANGYFEFVGLSPSTEYILRADTYDSEQYYIAQWYDNIRDDQDCNEATFVPAGETVNFYMQEGGYITGNVSDTFGNPVSDLWLEAFAGKCHEQWSGNAVTDANGDYRMGPLPAGEYYIFACAECSGLNFIRAWWDLGGGVMDCNAAEAVTVSVGGISPGYDFELEEGGIITGVITGDDGNPVTGVSIYVLVYGGDPCGEHIHITSGWSNPADGSFAVKGIPQGDFYLRTWSGDTNYIDGWWTDTGISQNCWGAMAFAVNPGETISGYDFQLDLGGSVSGFIYDAVTYQPLRDVHVFATSEACWGQWLGGAHTDENGYYRISGIVPGPVYVRTQAAAHGLNYVDEFWDDVIDCGDATAIEVVADQDAGGIDFYLDPGQTITGHVYDQDGTTPIADAHVNIFSDRCHNGYLHGVQTDSTGYFKFIGLSPSAEYILKADTYDSEQYYIAQWYDNIRDDQDCNEATFVSAGETVNFYMQEGGYITGNVSDTVGNPVSDLWLEAFAGKCHEQWSGGHSTDQNGDYRMGPLPAGEYYIHACTDCSGLNFVRAWWDSSGGVMDCNAAEAIEVFVGEPSPGNDFVLEEGGILTGVLTGDDGDPITGVSMNVVVYSDPCGEHIHITSGWSNPADGSFSVKGIPQGDFYLRTWSGDTNYVGGWWTDTGLSQNCWEATAFSVNPGETISGYDFQLDLGGSVSGTVRDVYGNPITGASLHVVVYGGDPCGWIDHISDGWSNPENGTFTVGGIPGGTYFLRVWSGDANYVGAWWTGSGGSHNCWEATAFAVNPGETTSGYDFQLETGGYISGTVQDDQGNPITGEPVDVVLIQGDPCGGHHYFMGVLTDPADGTFLLGPIPAGEYFLRTYPADSQYISKWWNAAGGSPYCEEAQSITVFQDFTLEDVTFTVVAGGYVEGTVVDTDHNPIAGLWMEAFTGQCWDNWAGGAMTDDDGFYSIGPLPSGDVFVRTCAGCNNTNYLDLWYTESGGTDDCNLAEPVTVIGFHNTGPFDFTLERGPRRESWTQVSADDGILGVGFDLLPAFDGLILSAEIRGPNGFIYEFDLENDTFQWLNDCYFNQIMWWKSFSQEFDYGEYRLTLRFRDGYEKTYIHNLQEVTLTPVDENSMNYVLHPDGSIDFSFTKPGNPDQWYRVLIEKDGRYLSMPMADETLHVSAHQLRCLELGTEYEWHIRVHDTNEPYNATLRTTKLPLVYNPSALDGRVTFFTAQHHTVQPGYLELYFNTRPGSRNAITSATVTGPSGFSYDFDLDNDWADLRTESRILVGFSKFLPLPSSYSGTYTLNIQFSDDHWETHHSDLPVASAIPVDATTIQVHLYENGNADFTWDLPEGGLGQYYQMRLRSADNRKEFYVSNFALNRTALHLTFWDFRAVPPGELCRLLIRSIDPTFTTQNRSAWVSFLYDPFDLSPPIDIDGDGDVDGEDLASLAQMIEDGLIEDIGMVVAQFAENFGRL